MTVLRFNAREVASLPTRPSIVAATLRVGESIAETARRLAPKDSGAGAASIRAEVATASTGPEVHVSVDRDHFYLLFAEFGTSRQSPRPFLRPAARPFA